MSYIPRGNFSLSEFISMSDLSNPYVIEEILKEVQKFEAFKAEMESELKGAERQSELYYEQMCAARDVLENIQNGVGQARSVGQAREAVEYSIDNGYFEM